jgi:hypothetical protein
VSTNMAQQLTAAGFTNVRPVRAGWCAATDPAGQECAVLMQDAARWHWFHKAHRATASNGTAATCHRGGLGDAIDDDASMRRYKRLLNNPPAELLRDYVGVYEASCQVYHDR